MRRAICVWLCLLVVAATGLAAKRGTEGSAGSESLAGIWTGTWDSASSGSGGFELTLEKGKDGAMSGRVSVTGEPAYKATLSSLSFDGPKMTARYDFPPAPEAEVVLAATFEGTKATGTWTVREKAGGNEALNGTWKVTRKP